MLGTAWNGIRGREVVACDGAVIGNVADTWPLDGGGEPELILVRLGRRFPQQRYLPLEHARLRPDGRVQVPYEKWLVDDAPCGEDRRWGDPAHVALAYWLTAADD